MGRWCLEAQGGQVFGALLVALPGPRCRPFGRSPVPSPARIRAHLAAFAQQMRDLCVAYHLRRTVLSRAADIVQQVP